MQNSGIDTIILKSPHKPGNISKIKGIPDHHLLEGHPFFKGYLNNLSIQVNEAGTKIEGSLPRYINGNNSDLLTVEATKEALNKISDDLSLNLQDAKASRFDFAVNIFLDNPPASYYRFLGNSSILTTKGIHNSKTTTVYFTNGKTRNSKNGNVCFTIYDKKHELGKKNLPKAWEGCNVARLEMRYMFMPQSHFKREITSLTLTDQAFIDSVKSSFKRIYTSIQKIQPAEFNIETTMTQKKVVDLFAAFGIESYGYDNAMAFIGDLNSKGLLIHRTYVPKIKNELSKLVGGCIKLEPSTLVSELDYKVNLSM